MALPVAPLAGLMLRYGAVALAAYVLARRVAPGRTDQRAEDAMDATPDGLTAHRPRDREQMNATARFRRVLRFGDRRGIEIDAVALGRLRIRRV